MTQVRPRMTHLFAQLGLDSSAEGIAQFIHEHQLPKDKPDGGAVLVRCTAPVPG